MMRLYINYADKLYPRPVLEQLGLLMLKAFIMSPSCLIRQSMQSSFYGPFREAVDSNPRFGDKKTYQMNPANYREALIETCEDESEGADILLVKRGLPYLDIIRLLRDNSPLPIAAYQTKV